MSDIVERLREHAISDHSKGCDGRCYACGCGYDERTEFLLGEATAEIERLGAEHLKRCIELEDARKQLREAAAFLDGLAERLTNIPEPQWKFLDKAAADCRAMAEKLRAGQLA